MVYSALGKLGKVTGKTEKMIAYNEITLCSVYSKALCENKALCCYVSVDRDIAAESERSV